MLTVSVVVPAHNEERRIGRCIAALRREFEAQGMRGEILVVHGRDAGRSPEAPGRDGR